jgi:hypothetical protein
MQCSTTELYSYRTDGRTFVRYCTATASLLLRVVAWLRRSQAGGGRSAGAEHSLVTTQGSLLRFTTAALESRVLTHSAQGAAPSVFFTGTGLGECQQLQGPQGSSSGQSLIGGCGPALPSSRTGPDDSGHSAASCSETSPDGIPCPIRTA